MLFAFLAKHSGGSVRSGKAVSKATKEKRNYDIVKCVMELWALGFNIQLIESLNGKHLVALVNHWMKNNISRTTIKNRLSVLRVLSIWIKKPGLVRDMRFYVPDDYQGNARVTEAKPATSLDKDINFERSIQALEARDPLVALMFKVQCVFKLKVKEVCLLRPVLADKGSYLDVCAGTHGKRNRIVKIESDEQLMLLAQAKSFALNASSSMMPRQYSVKGWLAHYYHVLKKCGISRKHGITGHGLKRHYIATASAAL